MAGVQKRKIQWAISFLLLVTLYFSGLTAQAQYSGGTGDPNDPYQIATAEDLMLLGKSRGDYDKHFILTADIDLDPNLPGRQVFDKAVIAPDIDPVEGRFQGAPFGGVFDGNGHTISNLTIEGGAYLGLFGDLGSGAKIFNMGLEAVDVSGTGALVGGLVGGNSGYVTECYSTGTVSGARYVGGLVGNSGGSITTSYSTGTVTGDENNVGGLVGRNIGGSIATSYSTATVSGRYNVGGLVGYNWEGSISTSYSTGAVTGDRLVGGLLGHNWLGIIAASFWDMETSDQASSAGGTGLTTAEMQNIDTYLNAGWDFVDETLNGTCDYWQISPGDYPQLRYHAGDRPVMTEGLGTAQEPYLIRDARDLGTVWFNPMAHYRLEASVDLSGITWSMAVIPWFGGTFDGNGYVISNLHIQGSRDLGLFGDLGSGAKISNLGLEAIDVNGTGDYIGGLVGRNIGGSIATSYSTGTVTGNEDVGGLVGYNWEGSISTSYSTSTVTGNEDVGGLVGRNMEQWSMAPLPPGPGPKMITNCYSTGRVSGDLRVGGLVGFHWGQSEVTASFWDIETSDLTWSAGGEGKPTAEMQTASTFLDAGWDFVAETANGTDDIWWILEGQDYPRLSWELTESIFIVVDDFESYNDLDPGPGDPKSNRIFNVWIDGYGDPNNGSIVGHTDWWVIMETVIVHGGKQSMPFFYSNTGGTAYSEAERTFAVGQNWTRAGVQTLVLYFHGTEGNTGQLYVKVNGRKVVYNGDETDIAKTRWTQWNIELAPLGIDLENVTKLAIGIDGNGARGTLYIDDIRLYRPAPKLAPQL